MTKNGHGAVGERLFLILSRFLVAGVEFLGILNNTLALMFLHVEVVVVRQILLEIVSHLTQRLIAFSWQCLEMGHSVFSLRERSFLAFFMIVYFKQKAK